APDERADLERRLADPRENVRQEAVQGIPHSSLSDEEKAALYQRCLRDSSAEVRALVLGVLFWHTPDRPEVMLPVIRAARKDRSVQVRVAAVRALAPETLTLPGVLPDLLACLEDKSPQVQAAAIAGLGARGEGDPAAIEAVRHRLAARSPAVR